jgi:hypothetical protein
MGMYSRVIRAKAKVKSGSFEGLEISVLVKILVFLCSAASPEAANCTVIGPAFNFRIQNPIYHGSISIINYVF